MKLTRRDAIKLGLVGSSGLLLPWVKQPPAFAQLITKNNFSPTIDRFKRPFQPLSLLKPSITDENRDRPIDYYEITLQKAEVELLPNKKTLIWSYSGLLPGPLIRQRGGLQPEDQGRASVIRFINKLGTTIENNQATPIATSIHLHGMASLPQYDGYAEDTFLPGHFKDYHYPNDRASTLWYHDHAVGKTSRNVYMGLAGTYIVQDERERQLPLPKGDYDVPIMLQNVILDADGQLVFNDHGQRGLYGEIVLVNGVPFPYMQVARRKYRFRVLNASPSRTYQLVLSQKEDSLTSGDVLTVIATDAGLLESPVPLTSPLETLRMGVGERCGFVIDFAQYKPGTSVYLCNPSLSINVDADSRSRLIMRFDIGTEAITDESTIPTELRKFNHLDPNKAVRTRTFRFERNGNQWKINNKTWDPNRVDANPKLGDIEIWSFVNTGGGWVHPVHVHLVDSQILDRNGLPPRAYERGWKDVLSLGELDTLRIITQFTNHKGKYMIHCHNLVHEDHDMMTQFEVGQGGCSPCSDPAKPISDMKPLGEDSAFCIS